MNLNVDDIKIIVLKGKQIHPYIPELAKLRMKIFRDYPYLYIGDEDYEENYLRTYVQCPECIMILVLDGVKVVGASTAIPLQFECNEFQKPFLDQGKDISDIFYLGESLLLPEYRGKGIYRKFFQLRESAARDFGCGITAFAEVKRASDDPKRPKDYKPLDSVWNRFGYEKHPELIAYYSWQEIDESQQSLKPMVFWLKKL